MHMAGAAKTNLRMEDAKIYGYSPIPGRNSIEVAGYGSVGNQKV